MHTTCRRRVSPQWLYVLLLAIVKAFCILHTYDAATGGRPLLPVWCRTRSGFEGGGQPRSGSGRQQHVIASGAARKMAAPVASTEGANRFQHYLHLHAYILALCMSLHVKTLLAYTLWPAGLTCTFRARRAPYSRWIQA